MSEQDSPRGGIVERVVRPDGKAVRRIHATLVFELEEDDQRCGDAIISLAVGEGEAFVTLPPVYNFYDTMNEIARREPADAVALAELLARVNDSQESSSRTYQAAYDAHMEAKYPGWQGLVERAKPGRATREPEHTKSAAKIEDLDL